jgi:hypothetical protein
MEAAVSCRKLGQVYHRWSMWHKAAATGIVLGIASIAGGFLYSPVKTPGPSVKPVAVRLPSPLEAAPAAEVVTSSATARPQANRRLSSTAYATVTSEPPPALPVFDRIEAPALSSPPPVEGAPILSDAPLPSVVGQVPSLASSSARPRGAMGVAGQSIGAAFVTTGRGIRAAFKHAF